MAKRKQRTPRAKLDALAAEIVAIAGGDDDAARTELAEALDGWEKHDSEGNITNGPWLEKVAALEELGADDVERLWETMIAYQEASRAAYPLKIIQERTIHTDKPIAITFPSDLHIGHEHTDHQRIRADFELINSCSSLFAYLGGDGIENFIIHKLAHAARSDLVRPSVQWLFYRHLVKILSPSLLAVGDGNHTAWSHRLADIDQTFAELRQIPTIYTYEGGYLDLHLVRSDGHRQSYRIFRKHRPRFNSVFNLTHTVKRFYEQGRYPFDVGVVEHHHCPDYEVCSIHSQERIAIRTGTYKLYDPHAEEYGYTKGGYGVPSVCFSPHERLMTPLMRLEDTIAFLGAWDGRKVTA